MEFVLREGISVFKHDYFYLEENDRKEIKESFDYH
jgi:hypothetical protein